MGFNPPQPILYDVPCFKFFTNCFLALSPFINTGREGDSNIESVEYLYFYIIIWNIANTEEDLRRRILDLNSGSIKIIHYSSIVYAIVIYLFLSSGTDFNFYYFKKNYIFFVQTVYPHPIFHKDFFLIKYIGCLMWN